MDFLLSLLAHAKTLLHLSPLDWTLAALILLLTFSSHILRLVRMAGDEYVEFTRWRREFCRRCRDTGEAGPPDGATKPPARPPHCSFCNTPPAPDKPQHSAAKGRQVLAQGCPVQPAVADELIDLNCGRCGRPLRMIIAELRQRGTVNCRDCEDSFDSREPCARVASIRMPTPAIRIVLVDERRR